MCNRIKYTEEMKCINHIILLGVSKHTFHLYFPWLFLQVFEGKKNGERSSQPLAVLSQGLLSCKKYYRQETTPP